MSEPTMEQLERTALALGFPILPEALRPSYYEEALRNLHKIVQEVANGDEEAGRRLAMLREAFAREI
jgi:hypothetical protein